MERFDFERRADFHASYSIQLCELIEAGWCDFSKCEWNFDSYDSEQRDRLWLKFQRRFYYRELGIVPPGIWKHELLRKLDEIMPKYKVLYAAIAQGVDVLQDGSEYHKSRSVYSEFPQTQLSGANQDYASTGTDMEYETVRLGNFIDAAQSIRQKYSDVDVMILDELETMFSAMYTVNVNSW